MSISQNGQEKETNLYEPNYLISLLQIVCIDKRVRPINGLIVLNSYRQGKSIKDKVTRQTLKCLPIHKVDRTTLH